MLIILHCVSPKEFLLMFESIFIRALHILNFGVLTISELSWISYFLEMIDMGYSRAVPIKWTKWIWEKDNPKNISTVVQRVQETIKRIATTSTLMKLAPSAPSMHSIRCCFWELSTK